MMIGAVILGGLGGGTITLLATGDSGDAGTPQVPGATPTLAPPPGGTPSAARSPQHVKIGERVRDGAFEFVVKRVRCGLDRIGEGYVAVSAQGQFCLVTLSVKNTGDGAQVFADNNQKAYGVNGKEYSSDTEAGLYANDNADVFVNEINPGNTLNGVIVFDIPTDAELAAIELHDSATSAGAKVTV